MRTTSTLLAALFFFCHAQESCAAENVVQLRRTLTVADTIASTRFFIAPRQVRGDAQGAVSFSPSRNLFLVRLVSGDLQRNQLVLKIMVGSTKSVKAATQARVIAVFTTSYTNARYWPVKTMASTDPNPVVWRDENHASFLWEDRLGIVQVIEIDVRSGRLTYLTSGNADVVAYSFGANGALLYMARGREDWRESARLVRQGFAVTNGALPDLVAGHVQDDPTKGKFVVYLLPAHSRVASLLRIYANQLPFIKPTDVSPDGRFAIVWATVDRLPKEWAGYRSSGPHNSDYFREAFEHRESTFGKRVGQLYLVDFVTGHSRPLWAAPSLGGEQIAWAPDSKRVILANAFLPTPEPNSLGSEGRAIAELNVSSGEISLLPSVAVSGFVRELHFTSMFEILGVSGTQNITWRKNDRDWEIESSASTAALDNHAALAFELVQDANTPPTLWVRDTRTGLRGMVIDPNHDFASRFALGHVVQIEVPDPDGRIWTALLYYPVGYVPGVRYPLVIQVHGHAPVSEFSLFGVAQNGPSTGMGPGISVYAAQVLANHGFMVLQLDDLNHRNGSAIVSTPLEGPVYTAAYETVVSNLDKLGLVDPNRVGLSGYSRTVFHIQYALSHSAFHFAAAIASDGVNGSYLEAAALPPEESAGAVNGDRPFRTALQDWIVRAPAFNADRIKTPLLIQHESGGLAGAILQWEMFSRLRELGRPVEMDVVPDIEHSIHGVQIPLDCLASQERAVDWFDFWLNDHIDPAPSKANQYRRWEVLRQHQINVSMHNDEGL